MSERVENNNLNDIISAQNDHFTDFASVDDLLGFKSRIIFSEKAILHMYQLANETMSLANHPERGCFFLGRELGKDTNQIYIDDFTTDFQTADGFFEGGALVFNTVITPSREWPRGELTERITRGNYDCCIHFHTHPPIGYFDVFSDRDYMLFESLAHDCKRIHNVDFFAILSTPNRNTKMVDRQSKKPIKNIQFSAIYCRPKTSSPRTSRDFEYFRFPNICYISNGVVYEIGRYDRTEAPRLSSGRKVPQRATIQALGRDPKTGQNIEDKRIGIWRNGQLYLDDVRREQGIVTPRTIAYATRGQSQSAISNARGIFSRIRSIPFRGE